MADHRPQGEGRPTAAPTASPISASPASGTAACTIPSTTRPRSSPSPIGRSIGRSKRCSSSSGSPRQVRSARHLRLRRQDVHASASTIPRARRSSRRTNTDAYGGLAGEFPLSKGATLGVYTSRSSTGRQPQLGGGSFRVEEYKKPEFEVTVEAPKEPVTLGEKIKATIKAKYYFGAPVTQRQGQVQGAAHQLHAAPGIRAATGTGSTAAATGGSPPTTWYPGWREWGCKRPMPIVVGPRPGAAGGRAGERGRDRPRRHVKVAIDTLPAKELHGDQDHSTRSPPRWSTNRGAPSSAPATCWWPASRSRSTPGSIAAITASATPSRPSFDAQTLDQQAGRGQGRADPVHDHLQRQERAGRESGADLEARHRRRGQGPAADQGRRGRASIACRTS